MSSHTMPKYIVICTGYTSRLTIPERISVSFDEFCNRNNIVAIKDELWSSYYNLPIWTFPSNVPDNECEKIKSFIENEKLDGVIVFRIPPYEQYTLKKYQNKLVKFLGDLDYCSWCIIRCIYERKNIEEFSVVKVDCESG